MGLTKPWEAEPAPEPDSETPEDAAPVAEVHRLPGTEAASTEVAVPGAGSPGRGALVRAQIRGAAAEAGSTAAATVDGTVTRDRPPSLADQHAHLTRREDPAGVPALRVVAQGLEWVGLALNAWDYARAWAVRRPGRMPLGLFLRLGPLLVATQLLWGWPL